MADGILIERDGAVARVVINRPEKRNALDRASWQLLGDTFEELSADTALRCIVVTGAGGKAFGSGNDISEFATLRTNAEQVAAYNAVTARAISAIEESLHPTVARIAGFCLGGGLEIALACDLRIATRGSRFGLPVKNMGIFLDPALSETMVNTIGRAAALEMVLEGRVYHADEALARGLIGRVVDDDALDAEVAATAQAICAGAPLAARFNRRAIRRIAMTPATAAAERAAAAAYGDTEDYRAAWQAFAEKRKPDFRGR